MVTTDGMPLGFEIFDGNRIDVTTVEEIVETMERKYGKARRIWALDRGMVSEENLRFIRERGGHYIVGTPRSDLCTSTLPRRRPPGTPAALTARFPPLQ